jgi:hypothetical protein
MDTKQYALYAGVGIVVATHVYMVAAIMPESMQMNHAYINLAAAGLIVYATMY